MTFSYQFRYKNIKTKNKFNLNKILNLEFIKKTVLFTQNITNEIQ